MDDLLNCNNNSLNEKQISIVNHENSNIKNISNKIETGNLFYMLMYFYFILIIIFDI